MPDMAPLNGVDIQGTPSLHTTRELSYAEAVREALRLAMQADERVFLLGEDIGVYGGAFGVTTGLLEEFGAERVRDTPISEAAIAGAAIGAALVGMRPVAEIQFMDFLMWVSHIHDGRPITQISEVSHERQEGSSLFRAKVESEAKVQMVRAWYVYSDDEAWRDLMWYHLIMEDAGNGYYQVPLQGKIPDAFMIEVGDIALGIPGYVTSLPQKLTDAPVVERVSRGSRPRLWEPEG